MNEGRDRAREPMMQVAVAENTATAQMIQDLLGQAGIRSLLKNTNDASQFTGGSLPFTLQIFVLEGDAAAAEVLLADERPVPARQLGSGRRRYRKRT